LFYSTITFGVSANSFFIFYGLNGFLLEALRIHVMMTGVILHRFRRLGLRSLFFSMIVGVYFLSPQGLRHFTPTWVEPPREAVMRWDPELFRALTFGHWPTVVDWLWIRFLQDPAISHVPEGARAAVYFDLDLATDLDPAFFEIYHHGASVLTVIRDDSVGARDLLLKGERFRVEELPQMPASFKNRYWGREWLVPFQLGYVYLFELDDLPQASLYYRLAATLPGSPPYLQGLSQRLETREGQYEAGLQHLNFLLQSTESSAMRESLTQKRDSLFLSHYLYQINQRFAAFLKTQPQYRSSREITEGQLRGFWNFFIRQEGVRPQDPWGGDLYVDEQGRVRTTSEIGRALGMEND
jgi:hypothetical protein